MAETRAWRVSVTIAAPSVPPCWTSWAVRATCAGARAALGVQVRGGGANAFSSAPSVAS